MVEMRTGSRRPWRRAGGLGLVACVFATAMAFGGCAVDPGANQDWTGCKSDGDCDAGVCRHGFCVVDSPDGQPCEVDGELIASGGRVSCYTGSEAERDVGECRSGEQECVDGQLTSCLGEVLPDVETCNDKDDDCDGEVDEFDQATCDTGMQGPCAEGELVCRGSVAACEPTTDPAPERCNGVDDDCDGEVDEDLTPPCYDADDGGCVEEDDGSFTCMGLCKPGTGKCEDGDVVECDETMVDVTEETENGEDDDCDGEIDEDLDCEDGSPCYGGPDGTETEGTCHAGTLDCATGTCDDQQLPEDETCANMAPEDATDLEPYDNDCNGEVDDVPDLGEPCVDESTEGVCRRGTFECSDKSMICKTPDPSEEICDGKDNDCDGEVDEDFDLLNDESNCGECGNTCDDGLTCCSGECVNLQTSEDACGSCDNSCGSGLTCCGGSCADTQRDSNHCGGCGEACLSTEECSNGKCCPMGFTNCGGLCVDTNRSKDHCGDCGESCTSSQMCQGGECCPPMGC